MDSPSRKGPAQEPPKPQEPPVVQIDPKCLRSVLKEFAEPLRTGDSRADFFAVYRKESDEFDRDYAKKYDEDLNTSLIFAGLFSAVSSAFIIDVQSKLEPDPNEMTAAYMRILIHTMNNSLFPDADLSSTTWTGPPPEIVTVQSLLYASLATSLFAAFLAMLGKQWVNRYLRNRGGSAADKSRDRQRKLDGLKKWHFHLTIESLPVMLQFALLLLGCALSHYLWTISRAVAGIIVTGTLFGITSYVFLSLAATLHYNCPYQTPPSILTRTLIKRLARSNNTFARSLRSITASVPPVDDLRRVLLRLRAGFRRALHSLRCISGVPEETEHIPLAVITSPPPARIFEDVSVDWEACKAETRCVSWVLSSSTDTDVIYSTVRFAADMVWYPETVDASSPHILADLFFDCLLDGQPIPGKLEHLSSIGMALASVLSTQLTIEPENQVLVRLCKRIGDCIEGICPPRSMFWLVAHTLRCIVKPPANDLYLASPFRDTPSNLSPAQKLWLSRIVLQITWRLRRVDRPIISWELCAMECIYETFTTNDDTILATLKTNCFLTMALSLGLRIDIRDLHVPNNNDGLQVAINLFYQRLQTSITEGKAESDFLEQVIFTSGHLDPPRKPEHGERCLLWLSGILNSTYQDRERCRMADMVVRLIGTYEHQIPSSGIHLLLGFLSLCEKISPKYGLTALRILSSSSLSYFDTTILPLLASILLPTHVLQSRRLALEIFNKYVARWFSLQMENVPYDDLNSLLQAVGDPFQFPDLPLQGGQPMVTAKYEPMNVTVVLIEFASSDLWRNHLRRSNFTSCEETLSTEEGRRTALSSMLHTAADSWPEFLCTYAKIIAAITRLEELQCFNTAEVVILWAWTVGVVDAMDHDVWGQIEHKTINFYQTDGTRRLTHLSQHITDRAVEDIHGQFLLKHYQGRPCWVGSVHHGVPPHRPDFRKPQDSRGDLRVAQACQLRRLYRLFGYNSTTWKEAVGAEGREGTGMSSRGHVTPAQFTDLACDYP